MGLLMIRATAADGVEHFVQTAAIWMIDPQPDGSRKIFANLDSPKTFLTVAPEIWEALLKAFEPEPPTEQPTARPEAPAAAAGAQATGVEDFLDDDEYDAAEEAADDGAILRTLPFPQQKKKTRRRRKNDPKEPS